MKRQKSLLLRLLTIVTITILAPSILTFLVFFRTVPERMETQAQANVGFYIDQTNASVKNSMELAREVAFSALGDPMLQKNMQRTEFYLSSMGRGALEQMVGSVTAYQSAWSRNVLSSIYLFRDDGQYTFYSAKGAYAQEQRRMENICNQSRELSSAKTLFQIPGIGYISYQAITQGDIPFTMFYIVFIEVLTQFSLIIADISYAVADPRVRAN